MSRYIPVEPPAWVHVSQVKCRRGHHIPRHAIPTPAGAFQCQHMEPGTRTRCLEWVYVVACHAAEAAFVVHVDYQQVRELLARDLTPLESLRFLRAPTVGAA